VWQLGFGSGFKCNSAVWRATRWVLPLTAQGAPGGGMHAWRPVVHAQPRQPHVCVCLDR
jgi:hypothetical protein